jgi:hypothetical protein
MLVRLAIKDVDGNTDIEMDSEEITALLNSKAFKFSETQYVINFSQFVYNESGSRLVVQMEEI